MPRLGVAPLLALRHGTRKYMALARCCVAELGDATPVNDMTTRQGPDPVLAHSIEDQRVVASRADRRRIWYRSDGIAIATRDPLDVDSGLDNTLRETWTRRERVRPSTIKALR